MKTLKLLGVLFCMLIVVSACKDEPRDPADIDLSEIQIELPNLKLGEYKIPQDLTERYTFLIQAISELQDIIKEDEEVDYITFDIYVTPEGSILNNVQPHKDDEIKRASDPAGALFGKCPDGWDFVGTGLNKESVAQLIEEALADVQGVGDCKQVQVKVGLFGATVCSKDC